MKIPGIIVFFQIVNIKFSSCFPSQLSVHRHPHVVVGLISLDEERALHELSHNHFSSISIASPWA